MLYHYTSLGAFISILQEDGLHLRMSRYSDMEDKLEVAYAMRLMKEHGIVGAQDKEICETVYPYVLSFCNTNENYPMWRLYADAGKGIVFGVDEKFEIKNLKDTDSRPTPPFLMKVLYAFDKAKAMDKLAEVKNHFKQADLAYPELLASFVKHPSYSFEEETRMILLNHGNFAMSCDAESQAVRESDDFENCNDMEIRYNGSSLVRYMEVVIPKEYLNSVTLGFNAQADEAEKMRTLLKQKGYNNVQVGFCRLYEDRNLYGESI